MSFAVESAAMELDKALARISEIHAHVARGELFRGYRASTVAVTGVLSIVGAAIQVWGFAPVDGRGFVLFWVGVAGVCALLAAIDLALQERRADAALRARAWPVLSQYLPSAAVGGAVAVALCDDAATVVLLPGLWSIAHGLGIFASRPFLPRAIGWVAMWFLGVGVVLLLHADTSGHVGMPNPWEMAIAFGVGQSLLALVLHADLERGRVGARRGVR